MDIKTQSFIRKNHTGLIAHRGAHLNAPENSIKAIRDAGILGYEMVELDVQFTSAGIFVLMHDKTIDRTTNGTGNVTDYSLNELKQLHLKNEFIENEDLEFTRVPTFEEACEECAKWGMGINVDCSKITWSEEVIVKIVGILKGYKLWSKSFFVQAEQEARQRLTKLYPDANVTWLTSDSDPTDNIRECKCYNNAFVTYSSKHLNDELVSIYQRERIPLFVYQCDTVNVVKQNILRNVRFIETDTILPQQVELYSI